MVENNNCYSIYTNVLESFPLDPCFEHLHLVSLTCILPSWQDLRSPKAYDCHMLSKPKLTTYTICLSIIDTSR